MLILCGKTCSGKTTLAKELEKLGWEKIITYTTRPKRAGETDSDYHFVEESEFKEMIKNEMFAEYVKYETSYGHCCYGSAKSDYQENKKAVIILDPYGAKMAKRNMNSQSIKVVYITASDKTLRKRAIQRGDSPTEIEKRLKTDKENFKNFESVADIILETGIISDMMDTLIKLS